MKNFFKKFKTKKTIIVISSIAIIVLAVFIAGYFIYKKLNDTRIINTTIKINQTLSNAGFKDLYQKKGNSLCVNVKNTSEQKKISEDMAWAIQTNNNSNIKTTNTDCQSGQIGIKIK